MQCRVDGLGFASRSAVKNYDTLAEKTVFMPGSNPLEGFTGFHRGAASLLPGVAANNYVAADAAPLFVPTMAVAPDLQQMSVRMSFMEKTPEKGLLAGTKFSACSAVGPTGWSPLLPNKFVHTVLEPLMKAQGATSSLKEFWAKHLPEVAMPELIVYAQGATLSVSRAQIRSHPKAFYEALLAEVSDQKNPYQAYFIEYMWWYIFHGKEAPLCPKDFASQTLISDVAPAASRRELSHVQAAEVGEDVSLTYAGPLSVTSGIAVLEPTTGSRIRFGQIMKISWVATLRQHMRVELFRYGNFETVLLSMHDGNSFNWPVLPGPDKTATHPDKPTRPYGAHPDTGYVQWDAESHPMWRTNYLLTPNDKYTIRVCVDSYQSANTDLNHCDHGNYASSGEFDILASIDVVGPPAGLVIEAGPSVAANALAGQEAHYQAGYIPVQWSSYFTANSILTIRLVDAVSGYTVVMHENAGDTGNFDMYIPPDTPSGQYLIQVTADCNDGTTAGSVSNGCVNRFMGSDTAQSGTRASGNSGVFTVVGHMSPPPSPPPSPSPPVAQAPFELPIIKAFQAQFGTGEMTALSGDDTSTTSTLSGANNCEYICRVANVVGRRRLLFGGLQYAAGTDVVGCTKAQRDCNCVICNRG